MSAKDIFETISSQYYQLTNSEKKVADYVLANRINAQYMSISELAEECEVADATISRFCRRLGLSGYSAFKLELAKGSLNARGMAQESDVRAAAEDEGRKDFDVMCKARLRESVAALEQTAKLISPDQLRRAAEMLYKARRVVCMGQGSSMVLAQEAWTLFSTISPKFVFISDSHFQLNSVAIMSSEDVILFFSYSGSTRALQDVMKVAKARNIPVILVSRFPKSPGGQMADVVLQCGSNEGPLQVGSAVARIAQIFVLDLLFTEVCGLDPEGSVRNRELVAEAASMKHL
ncbi:MurR/RpiR family transcriptional regulator [Pseudoflavonifractor phocaeensis]|uniref:MurR/RpiR family transcriptional regulator n=1 Tax=Pseudoflavonifractor phocaeensis TaxID=1870988 RepID=UPI00195F14CD|nr:MurR/RpiR family transcriptional regulator [Pseudoflavonifractor phocaeensis]MBM6869879.1 MurR/RpiR family transcriptional regulator [Pseudoflavonifractor phocaeensis]